MKRQALVVDDDAMIRRLVRTVLEAAEFDVVEAHDGSAALGLVNASRGLAPAVAIVDVMMPAVSGIELCAALDTDRTAVVMLTASDDDNTEAACRQAGARAFLTKPFSSVELLDIVESLVS